jgi:hypothetical protein
MHVVNVCVLKADEYNSYSVLGAAGAKPFGIYKCYHYPYTAYHDMNRMILLKILFGKNVLL